MISDIGAALQLAELMTLSKTIKRFVAVNAAFNHKPFLHRHSVGLGEGVMVAPP